MISDFTTGWNKETWKFAAMYNFIRLYLPFNLKHVTHSSERKVSI